MAHHEFDVDLEATGLGNLFVTDAQLLIRPPVPGQHFIVQHDHAYAYQLLNLGNDMGEYIMHIFCQAEPREAQDMLSPVFYAYVKACCYELWCDANVNYMVNGKVVNYEEHGFDDGSYTMNIKVHCNVADDDVETLLTKLTGDFDDGEHFVVVRPDSSELGFTASGFTVDDPPEPDLECCPGCKEPEGMCICEGDGIPLEY
jgi:hypothetical protein